MTENIKIENEYSNNTERIKMDDKYILNKLQTLMEERNWTYYRLAKESKLPLSTVRNLFNKPFQPSFSTLSRLCDGLGITLSQFFMEGDKFVDLSSEQEQLLTMYTLLSTHQREMVQAYIKGMLEK